MSKSFVRPQKISQPKRFTTFFGKENVESGALSIIISDQIASNISVDSYLRADWIYPCGCRITLLAPANKLFAIALSDRDVKLSDWSMRTLAVVSMNQCNAKQCWDNERVFPTYIPVHNGHQAGC